MQFFAWIILTMLYEINDSHAGRAWLSEGGDVVDVSADGDFDGAAADGDEVDAGGAAYCRCAVGDSRRGYA